MTSQIKLYNGICSDYLLGSSAIGIKIFDKGHAMKFESNFEKSAIGDLMLQEIFISLALEIHMF